MKWESVLQFVPDQHEEQYLVIHTTDTLSQKVFRFDKYDTVQGCPIGRIVISLHEGFPHKWVCIERSNDGYMILASLRDSLDQWKQLERGSHSEMECISYGEFIEQAPELITDYIRVNQYEGSELTRGVVELLKYYPGVPFGVTWNGGLAITRKDYDSAEKRMKDYLSGKGLQPPPAPRADAINPASHFRSLLGW
ncbi:MAG: hypothetical protein ACQETG_10095 [Thermodesulfobacteriota bacterium]